MPVPSEQGVHRRALLRDHAYESLRDAIVEGTLEPGERLRDSELEGWLGVSRTPIREALLRLERARLVVATPGRATIVAPVDLESTIDSQQVAAAMHELAARLATPLLAGEDLARLEEANARFAGALDRADVPSAIAADDHFHQVFVARCGNAVVPEVLERVVPVLRRVERMRFASFAGRDSVDQHAAIISAARAGDAERAAQLSLENWLSLRYTFAD
ncbi:MAG: GntR family transcriptional regulator [Intrasporangium sp.]|uniref:GntR family transcriptional regulator n=1 Tax=Intrasporangium sp. TaxID=1925024 RepID=UPI002647829E|nr:GntR family transcriptional regulator [Intrasporangium sp.]MDN5795528.1 GntR family transcriptional regulator [Intrasporangium sp.]